MKFHIALGHMRGWDNAWRNAVRENAGAGVFALIIAGQSHVQAQAIGFASI
jgi:hypothetical protein